MYIETWSKFIIEKINKAKSLFGGISTTDKPQAKLEEKKGEKTQITELDRRVKTKTTIDYV